MYGEKHQYSPLNSEECIVHTVNCHAFSKTAVATLIVLGVALIFLNLTEVWESWTNMDESIILTRKCAQPHIDNDGQTDEG